MIYPVHKEAFAGMYGFYNTVEHFAGMGMFAP